MQDTLNEELLYHRHVSRRPPSRNSNKFMRVTRVTSRVSRHCTY